MKIKKFLQYSTVGLFSLISFIIFENRSILAEGQVAYCTRNYYDIPTTVIDYPGLGTKYVIRWVLDYGGVDPLRRCMWSSNQFDINIRKRDIEFMIGEGRFNGNKVLCAFDQSIPDIPECDEESVLMYLNSNGQEIIEKIKDVNLGSSSEGPYHSGSVIIKHGGFSFINFSKLVEYSKDFYDQ